MFPEAATSVLADELRRTFSFAHFLLKLKTWIRVSMLELSLINQYKQAVSWRLWCRWRGGFPHPRPAALFRCTYGNIQLTCFPPALNVASVRPLPAAQPQTTTRLVPLLCPIVQTMLCILFVFVHLLCSCRSVWLRGDLSVGSHTTASGSRKLRATLINLNKHDPSVR